MTGEFLVGGMVLMALFIFLIASLAIFLFVFWIWMIVDCATRKFKNDTDKIVWILVILFANLIGAVIYYFIVKRKK